MPESVATKPTSASDPVARSPLAPAGETLVIDGWEFFTGTTGGSVAVADRSALAKVHISASASDGLIEALGTRFGRAAWVRGRLVIGSGPDEWLVLGAPGTAAELVSRLTDVVQEQSPGGAILDLTHGRALMRISGPATLDLLGRVTAIDLDDRLVPDGSALRTSVSRVVTDMVRDDFEGAPSYLLHCERSSGRYLQQSLLQAGAELGAVSGPSNVTWPDQDTAGS